VLKDMVYLMSARTLEDSRILMIPSELLRQAMEKDPAFARSMIGELARGFRTMVKAVKNQKLRTGAERLANYLLSQDAAQAGNGMVKLPYEKRLLASLLGITPENLSRAFRTLGPYGVSVNGSTIRIGDKTALRRFAKPTPLIDDPEN
jgi:CRP/FNR family transcriptional activator FtrB